MPALIEFDLDGTLIDASAVNVRASGEVFKYYQLEGSYLEVDHHGGTQYLVAKACLERIFEEKKILRQPRHSEVLDAIDIWCDALSKCDDLPIIVYDGVFDPDFNSGLIPLLSQDASLAMVTGNGIRLTNYLLERTGLAKYFPEELRISYELWGEKREEGIIRAFNFSQAYYRTEFDRIVYMGDTPKDIAAADIAKKTLPTLINACVAHRTDVTVKDLTPHNPDLLFPDFRNYPQVKRVLLYEDAA